MSFNHRRISNFTILQPKLFGTSKYQIITIVSCQKICPTCSGDDHVWPCAVAQRHNFFPTQDVYPPGLNGALRVPESQAATAVRPQCKQLWVTHTNT